MKTFTALCIAGIVISVTFYFLLGGKQETGVPFEKNTGTSSVSDKENVTIENGVQVITLQVKGGYTPKKTEAKSEVPTQLVMKTNGTYDCSTSLVIKSLKYRKVLPSTGETMIDIGVPKKGDVLEGICSMGMYSFSITFK